MKHAISSLALAAALTFSGAAVAQEVTTIGGINVTAENRADLQAHCDALVPLGSPGANQADDNAQSQAGNDNAGAGGAGGGEAGGNAANAESENDDSLFAAVTLEECREAGIVQ